VWVDLIDDEEEVPRGPDGGPPHVLALPINYEEEQPVEAEPQHFVNDGYVQSGFADTDDAGGSTQPVEGQLAQDDSAADVLFDFGSMELKPPVTQAKSPPRTKKVHTDEEDSDSSSSDSDSGSDSSDDGHEARAAEARRRRQQEEDYRKQQQQFEQQSRAAPSSSSSFGGSMFGASVSSFFKKSAEAAKSFAGGSLEKTPNEQQRYVLETLCRKLEEKYDRTNPQHVDTLKTIWRAAFPKARKFEKTGPQWQLLGFSQDDPADDTLTKKGGMLGLQCLSYYLEHNYGKQKSIGDNRITIAPSAVKAALHFAKFLSLPNNGYVMSQRRYWALFDTSGSFYEIISFILSLADNGECNIRAGFDRVFSVLDNKAPQNISEFYEYAR